MWLVARVKSLPKMQEFTQNLLRNIKKHISIVNSNVYISDDNDRSWSPSFIIIGSKGISHFLPLSYSQYIPNLPENNPAQL